MNMRGLMFPKPKDIKHAPEAIRIKNDGREICNMLTKAGRDEYMARIRQMWERQNKRCCLEGYIPDCPGRLAIKDATFEHEAGRGADGGHRDDRIKLPDGTWINGAAHWRCNSLKGSKRIGYNRGRKNNAQ